MKYSFCETLMWFALAKHSFRYLEKNGVSVDKKKAKKIYRQMTERTPDIGGLTENSLRLCLSGVLYRTKTLATGGDFCDFYICKKDSKWHKQRESEK